MPNHVRRVTLNKLGEVRVKNGSYKKLSGRSQRRRSSNVSTGRTLPVRVWSTRRRSKRPGRREVAHGQGTIGISVRSAFSRVAISIQGAPHQGGQDLL